MPVMQLWHPVRRNRFLTFFVISIHEVNMMAARSIESIVEDTALGWLTNIGWCVAHEPDIALRSPSA